jgi:DNA-binding transcriptional ArsR family regulator
MDAMGARQCDIAREVGVSKQSVSGHLKRLRRHGTRPTGRPRLRAGFSVYGNGRVYLNVELQERVGERPFDLRFTAGRATMRLGKEGLGDLPDGAPLRYVLDRVRGGAMCFKLSEK